MNYSNLIPNSARTPKERRDNASKAGKASGKARKERKLLRDAFAALLSGKVPDENNPHRKITGAEKVAFAIYDKAAAGEVKAARLMAEITGEYKQEISQEIHAEVETPDMRKGMTRAEARELLRQIESEI